MSDEGLEDEWRLFHVWRVEFSYVLKERRV